MKKPGIPGYLRHIVLLTDGNLGNEKEIFAALRHDLRGARLYTVTIGSAPNMFLATKMAQFGRGTSTHVANINDIEEQTTQLCEKIESPVLTDLKVSFEGVAVTDMFPQRLPGPVWGAASGDLPAHRERASGYSALERTRRIGAGSPQRYMVRALPVGTDEASRNRPL